MRDRACIVADIMKTVSTLARTRRRRATSTATPRCRICRLGRSSTPRATCCARWPRRSASRIVLQLRESSRCVHELVDALGVPQPLVSQHLRILKAAGVVAGERSGREVLYRLVDHHLAHIVVAAVTHAARGRPSDAPAPGVRVHPAARGDLRAAGEPRRLPVRPGASRRTAPPRRGHRPDHRVPHPAVDGRRRPGRHAAHRHRRIGVPALLGASPSPPGVPGLRLHRRGPGRRRRDVGRRRRPRARLLRRQPHDRDLRRCAATAQPVAD